MQKNFKKYIFITLQQFFYRILYIITIIMELCNRFQEFFFNYRNINDQHRLIRIALCIKRVYICW